MAERGPLLGEANLKDPISCRNYIVISSAIARPHAIPCHPVATNLGSCGGLSGGLANLTGVDCH